VWTTRPTSPAPEGLERLCRYVARPAIATERLSELPDARIAYELRHPWSDGTTRVVFEPQSFLEKLAALIPPPRAHLVTYHGVLAPAAAIRSRVVPGPSTARRCRGEASSSAPTRRSPWAELVRLATLGARRLDPLGLDPALALETVEQGGEGALLVTEPAVPKLLEGREDLVAVHGPAQQERGERQLRACDVRPPA
jgi:hypothetical protein